MHFTRVYLYTALTALFCYVKASPSITSPLGSNWQAGTTQTITWIDNGDKGEMPEYIDLYLMAGKMTALQQVGTIATNVTSKPGQHKWDIPKETPSGKDYAIRIGAPPTVSYSPYFEISGGSGARPDYGKEATYADASPAASNYPPGYAPDRQVSVSPPSNPGGKSSEGHPKSKGNCLSVPALTTIMVGTLVIGMNSFTSV